MEGNNLVSPSYAGEFKHLNLVKAESNHAHGSLVSCLVLLMVSILASLIQKVDAHIPYHFSQWMILSGKKVKADSSLKNVLVSQFVNVPVINCVSRLFDQKRGFDLVCQQTSQHLAT